MTEKEKLMQLIEENFIDMTTFEQKALLWVAKHIEIAQIVSQYKQPLSQQEFERETQKAVKVGDYAYFALLFFQRAQEINSCK